MIDSSLDTYQRSISESQIFDTESDILKKEQTRKMKLLIYPRGLSTDVLKALWYEGHKLRQSNTDYNICTPKRIMKWMDYSAKVEHYLQRQLISRGGELSMKDNTEFQILSKSYLTPEMRQRYRLGCQKTYIVLKELYENCRFYELLLLAASTGAFVLLLSIFENNEQFLMVWAHLLFLTTLGLASAAVWFALSPAEIYSMKWILPRVLARWTVPCTAGALTACYLIRRLHRR